MDQAMVVTAVMDQVTVASAAMVVWEATEAGKD